MKLISYELGGTESFGAVVGDRIVDFRQRLGVADLKGLLEAGALAQAEAVIEGGEAGDVGVADVTFLPPVPRPDKIIGAGLNYREHITETQLTEYPYPTLFSRFSDTQVGHLGTLWVPTNSTMLDYEGEIAIVIGRSGRRIPADKALDHVAGYACYNDASIRDWQRHTGQVIQGKNFPHTGGFGPWIVTADEVPDPAALTISTRLNGSVMQSACAAQMIFPIHELIAYISGFTRLQPGDVILTGSPSGVGSRRSPPLFMKSGDVVEVEVSHVGTLRLTVVDEPA